VVETERALVQKMATGFHQFHLVQKKVRRTKIPWNSRRNPFGNCIHYSRQRTIKGTKDPERTLGICIGP
jgi:hypothetical protein